MKKGMKKFEAEQNVNCSTTQIENQTKEICEGTLSQRKILCHSSTFCGSHKWENACYKDVEAPQENAQDGINATPPTRAQ